MRFPNTNKIRHDLSDQFGENAKLLEETIREVDWRVILRGYCYGFAVLLASIFLLIVTVRAALHIF